MKNILNKINITNVIILLVLVCGVVFVSSYITSMFNKTEMDYYIEQYNEFRNEANEAKEHVDSLQKIIVINEEIIKKLNDSIVVTVSNLNESNQRVEQLVEQTQELSQLLTDSILKETPVEVIDYITALEVQTVALKKSNDEYEILTQQLFAKIGVMEESLLIQTERADSLYTIVVKIPEAPSNPDKILGFIPKPTRTQTFILGIGTGIFANYLINKQSE